MISDRAGVSKGYGFVTFETEEEARKLTQEVSLLVYGSNIKFNVHVSQVYVLKKY